MKATSLHNATEWLNGLNIGGLFADRSFSIPFEQMVLILLVASVCLIFGRFKMGFLMAYGFLFYWVYIANRGFLMELMGGNPMGMIFYLIVGAAMGLTVFVGFLQENH
ncbi:MAG: hypothetical protein HY579_02495 [Nitrospinae bacterium]|nr:hypothetical protein [Nitrospinota bacterium]